MLGIAGAPPTSLDQSTPERRDEVYQFAKQHFMLVLQTAVKEPAAEPELTEDVIVGAGVV